MKKKVISRVISGLLTFCLVASLGMPAMQTSAAQVEENIPKVEETVPQTEKKVEETVPQTEEKVEETVTQTEEKAEETVPETEEDTEKEIPKEEVEENIEKNDPKVKDLESSQSETAKAAKVSVAYNWLSNDRYLEYPTNKTTAAANNEQGGCGAELLLDGNTGTKWEASWNNPPERVEITLSAGEAEYITGVEYVSRLDNNLGAEIPNFKLYSSVDGSTYADAAVQDVTLARKPGTFLMIFDTPVKAKSIKIDTNVKAISEMRLLYQPGKIDDYNSLLTLADTERKKVVPGLSPNNWPQDAINSFDEALTTLKNEGVPQTEEKIYEMDVRLVSMIRDLKRAMLLDTTELKVQVNSANKLVSAAVAGTLPLNWSQEAITKFQDIVTKAKGLADNPMLACGEYKDIQEELENGTFDFKQSQIRPEITYTGTVTQPLEYMMDGLLASHFQGSGTGESVYFELDYKGKHQFDSLTFQTWWATGQAINKVKVQVKDEEGNWQWVDQGKEYTMTWTTNTGTSETQKVDFDAPVDGSALRIYVMGSTGSNYVLDELSVGLSVNEADMSISLDKETLAMDEGTSAKLTATVLPETASNKKVNWLSSDDTIVTVDQKGNLKAVMVPEGQTSVKVTITAELEYSKKTAKCEVTVNPVTADSKAKEETKTRLENARKLAGAAKAADYKAGAIDSFKAELMAIEEELNKEVTLGTLPKLDARIAAAETDFSLNSLLPERNTRALIDRITGKDSSQNFIMEIIPADTETGMDVYEIGWSAADNKPVLRGNNAVSLATAYNYYLKYYAFLDFPYVGDCDLKLPAQLPAVKENVRIVFPYEYRHYFNENCEYKYTTSLYGEEDWQRRIDWMSMNGFNMFLLDIGNNYVWYQAREELGLDEAAISELCRSNPGDGQYFAEYPVSEEAMKQEGQLAKKVVSMAFDAGMEPEIRPFCGQIPFMFPNNHEEFYGAVSKKKIEINQEGSIFDGMFLYPGARWMGLPQGVYISPEVEAADSAKRDEMNQKFNQLSEIYYSSLQKSLGFDEYGRTPQFGYKDLVGEQGFVVNHEAFPKKVLEEMESLMLKMNPDAIWMQTSWRYQSWLTDYFDREHLMIVDLSADNRPKWNSTEEFGNTQWLWSMLFNFGGNTGMDGGMDRIADRVITDNENSSFMKGVAIAPEGGDTNPALYGLMAEMTWRSERPNMDQWLKDYAKRRYGAANYEVAKEEIDEFWSMLHQSVYSDFVSGDGPSQTLINASPQIEGAISRYWGSNEKVYKTEDIYPIWEKMLAAADKMPEMTDQFKYDLVDVTRQAIGDLSGDVYGQILPNYNKKDREATLKYANLMAELCKDMDKLLATTKEFMVSSRLEDAKNRGVTDADKLYYEKLERTFLTYWVLDDPAAGKNGGLTDYCNRHLSGLMTDYYGMRWQKFSEHVKTALDAGLSIDQFKSTQQPLLEAEITAEVVAWTESRESYPTEEQGDPRQISKELLAKYDDLIQEMADSMTDLNDTSKDLPLEGQTATAGSVENDASEGPASLAIDNNTGTLWHTVWAGSAREDQWLDIALDSSTEVDGFRYLPRQSGNNGLITDYVIELSNDRGATYHQVATGQWEADNLWKLASFSRENATNVRLKTVSALSADSNLYASAAEVRITAPGNVPEEIMEQLKSWISKSEQVKAGEYSKKSIDSLQAVLAEAKKIAETEGISEAQAKKQISRLKSEYDKLSGLASLTIQPPTKILYKINENFAVDGMTVTAVYKDESTSDVTEKVKVNGFDSASSGEKTITVSYFNVNGTFKITVEAEKPPVENDKRGLDQLSISNIGDQKHTGSAITPQVQINDGAVTLAEGKDYTVSCQNNVNPGTATMTIQGTGNYTGTVTKEFRIVAVIDGIYSVKDISYRVTNDAVSGKGTVNVNKPVKTSVKTVVIPDKVKIGVIEYLVKEIDNNAFKDCKSMTSVTIGKNVTKIGSNAFNGCSKLKTIHVKSNDIKSVGKDAFKGISKSAVIVANASKASAYEKMFKDKGQAKAVKIKKSMESVSIASIKDQKYTGKSIKPKLTVKAGSKKLVAGKDYKVTYSKNKSMGTATVKLTGMGSYTGTVSKNFRIVAVKGKTYTSGNFKYQVTGVKKDKETVALAGLAKKNIKTANIPAEVKLGSISYEVTEIKNNALKGKSSIKTVEIGKNVKKIGSSALEGLKNVTKIEVKSSGISSVGKNAFKGIKDSAKITVPKNKLKAYTKLFQGKGLSKKVKITGV